MHSIKQARQGFLPERIRLLFIAEAPPMALDRFFYYPDVRVYDSLFLSMMRALYVDAKTASTQDIRARKLEFLSAFKAEGFYLIDACDQPMPKYISQRNRRELIEFNLPTLRAKLRGLQDLRLYARTPVVLIGSAVHEHCRRDWLTWRTNYGFEISNHFGAICFPSCGRQQEFHEQITMVLPLIRPGKGIQRPAPLPVQKRDWYPLSPQCEQKFWARVDQSLNPRECWLWKGMLDGSGYGRFDIGRRRVGAHVVSWRLANNGRSTDNMVICHQCDHPFCVNPNHLWLGTYQENALDCYRKGRSRGATIPRRVGKQRRDK